MTIDRTERPLENIVKRFRHWWHGCVLFNRKWPHWKKDNTPGAKYAICKVCDGTAWWMWGWKNWRPDQNAQDVQGSLPDASSKFWAKHDGHGSTD